MTDWPYTHPKIGTCPEGCPMRGLCHCGCARPVSLSRRTHRPRGYVKGEPVVFVNGHVRYTFRTPGHWQAAGVRLARLLPMLELLKRRHGTMRAVADAIGVRPGTLWQWTSPGVRATADTKHVAAPLARKVVDATLALRRPVDPLEVHGADVQRRLPTAWERERARREATAAHQAWVRKGNRGEPRGEAPNRIHMIEPRYDGRKHKRESA